MPRNPDYKYTQKFKTLLRNERGLYAGCKLKGYSKSIAIDTETDGLGVHYPPDAPQHSKGFAVSMCDHDGRRWYWDATPIPFNNPYSSALEFKWTKRAVQEMRNVLSHYTYFVFANPKFDIQVLQRIGVRIPPGGIVQDVLAAAHVLRFKNPALKPLGHMLLDIPPLSEDDLKEAVRDSRKWVTAPKVADVQVRLPLRWIKEVVENLDTEGCYWLPKYLHTKLPHEFPDYYKSVCEEYAVTDALLTIKLWKVLLNQLNLQNLTWQYHREMCAIHPTMLMEQRGVQIHKENYLNALKEVSRTRDRACEKLREHGNLHGMVDFNPQSHKQCADLFFNHMGMSGGPSVGKAEIARLRELYPQPDSVLCDFQDFQSANSILKYLNGYGKRSYKVVGTGKRDSGSLVIHFPYRTTGIQTTRFSSSLGQNIAKDTENESRDLRRIFRPRPGHFWLDMDHDQLELRIVADVAEETTLIDAFKNGEDVHQQMADTISEMAGIEVNRALGKRVNFTFIYGAGPKLLESMTGNKVPGSDIRDALMCLYPNIMMLMKKLERSSVEDGYVETKGGYCLQTDYKRPYASLDFLVQGTAGDILKNGMIMMHDYIKNEMPEDIEAHLVFAIHDQLIFEITNKKGCKEVVKRLRELMEEAGTTVGIKTPVDAKIVQEGSHWSEGIKLPKVWTRSPATRRRRS